MNNRELRDAVSQPTSDDDPNPKREPIISSSITQIANVGKQFK
jgi:hypothetical protein